MPGEKLSNSGINTHHDGRSTTFDKTLDAARVDTMLEERWNPVTEDDYAVLAVRSLVLDMCTQHGGGHGGSALGMAAIGVALWKYVMRYNPSDPEWFDRDRFVLSNGE